MCVRRSVSRTKEKVSPETIWFQVGLDQMFGEGWEVSTGSTRESLERHAKTPEPDSLDREDLSRFLSRKSCGQIKTQRGLDREGPARPGAVCWNEAQTPRHLAHWEAGGVSPCSCTWAETLCTQQKVQASPPPANSAAPASGSPCSRVKGPKGPGSRPPGDTTSGRTELSLPSLPVVQN